MMTSLVSAGDVIVGIPEVKSKSCKKSEASYAFTVAFISSYEV